MVAMPGSYLKMDKVCQIGTLFTQMFSGVSFTYGLSPDLYLKLRLLSEHEAKSVILDLEGLTKMPSLSLHRNGLNFCKQRLKYGRHISSYLKNLKCLKINNKYIEEHRRLVFGYIYLGIRLSIEEQHFLKIK